MWNAALSVVSINANEVGIVGHSFVCNMMVHLRRNSSVQDVQTVTGYRVEVGKFCCFEETGILFSSHYTQVHSGPEWWRMMGFQLWFK